MRLFVAIEIDAAIRHRMAEYVESIKSQLGNSRWSRPEGLHITLKFLGNVADQRQSEIESALASISGAQFPISLNGIGVFPNARSPRVLWTGVQAGPELSKLAHDAEAALARLGFAPEDRAFSPHVTLARFRQPAKNLRMAALLDQPPPSFGTMIANQFHLYESKLSPKGSQYTKLASFPLTAADLPKSSE